MVELRALPSGAEPTAPCVPLFDPGGVKSRVSGFVEAADPLLRELVNFSTHVYAACLDGMQHHFEPEESLATMRLHLHIIELADAIEVLLRDGCGLGAVGLGRGAFEATLALIAIHTHGDFKEPSRAWLVASIRREIRILEGAQQALVSGSPADADRTTRLREIGDRIDALKRKLALPKLAAIAKRFEGNDWLKPFYGSASLEVVADKLDRTSKVCSTHTPSPVPPFSWRRACDIFYVRWSASFHGSDWARVWGSTGEGAPGLAEIRLQQALPEVVQMVANFLLVGACQQVHVFRPDQEPTFGRWYGLQVRERYLALGGVPLQDW